MNHSWNFINQTYIITCEVAPRGSNLNAINHWSPCKMANWASVRPVQTMVTWSVQSTDYMHAVGAIGNQGIKRRRPVGSGQLRGLVNQSSKKNQNSHLRPTDNCNASSPGGERGPAPEDPINLQPVPQCCSHCSSEFPPARNLVHEYVASHTAIAISICRSHPATWSSSTRAGVGCVPFGSGRCYFIAK